MKVRLKPYNPSAGCLRKTYTAPWGDTYVAGIWYNLEDVHAAHCDYLRTVRQRNRDEGSLLAFDVVDEAGARALQRAEDAASVERVATPPSEDMAPRAPLSKPGSKEDGALNQPPPSHELSEKKPAKPRAKSSKPRAKSATRKTARKSTSGTRSARKRGG